MSAVYFIPNHKRQIVITIFPEKGNSFQMRCKFREILKQDNMRNE